jgi:DNA polymerase-3 subunit beta
MNFTTDPRKLASAVSWAARRVPSKPTVPILAGMLIELEDSERDVSFTGFDHEVSTTATLHTTVHSEAGRCVVSGRLLAELVKSLPPKPVTIDVSDEQMTLTCGPVRASLPLMPAEDYPALPVAPEPLGQINAQDFAREAGRVLSACDITGNIASLEALTGVLVVFGNVGLTVTATNRYQLATNTISGWQPTLDSESAESSVLVPGEVLASVLRICDFDGPLSIGISGTVVAFSTGERVTVSRTLPVKEFPATFARLIPVRSEAPTVIDVEEVTDALRRAVMIQEEKEPVSLEFGDRLTLRAGSGRGQVTADLFCEHHGPDVEITANPAYLTSAIGSVGERAELTIAAPNKPILITAPKDPSFLHVMMPIRKPS